MLVDSHRNRWPSQASGPIANWRGIRPTMHPPELRCPSFKYGPIFPVVAPCSRGASPPSVHERIRDRTTMTNTTKITAAIVFTMAAVVVSTFSLPAKSSSDFGSPPFASLRELASPATGANAQPQLTVIPEGKVVLSWLERLGDGPRQAFRYAFREGDGWSAPTTIVERDSFFANWADVPAVVGLGGKLAAHWLQKSGPGTYSYDVRLAISDAQAKTWGADISPHRDGTQTEHGFASFFEWPGGGTGIIWLDGREMKASTHGGGGHDAHGGGSMTLRAARIDEDGKVGEDVLIDPRVCECCPTTAISTARGALIAYRDRSDSEVRDIAVMRLENGKWQGPTYVHADNWQINACPVNGPALAAHGDRVALAWFTAQGDTPRVNVAFSADAGKTFGKPIRVDEARTLGRVDTVMLEDGRAIVSWMEFTDSGSEIRARTVFPDGRRSPHALVAKTTSDRQSGYPRMVRAGKELIFAWVQTRPTLQIKTAVASVAK